MLAEIGLLVFSRLPDEVHDLVQVDVEYQCLHGALLVMSFTSLLFTRGVPRCGRLSHGRVRCRPRHDRRPCRGGGARRTSRAPPRRTGASSWLPGGTVRKSPVRSCTTSPAAKRASNGDVSSAGMYVAVSACHCSGVSPYPATKS